MRDILTGLAIIVIVALTTLLVAPYFVDWNGQRAFLETQLSRALGQPVTIGGSIDLKLLPTPYIRLNQAVIGSDGGAVRVGIHYLDLELAVAPLLHGEFDIVEGQLEEPTIRLTLQPDRTLPAFPAAPALAADIRLERIGVKDGTLAIADPASGRTFVTSHLDFTAEAPSIAGPFKGSGTAGDPAAQTKFRFSTGEARGGRTHLHFALGETFTHPGLDLDGDLALRSDGTAEEVRQSFEGTAVATGHLLAVDGTALAWRLAGPLKADPSGATLAKGELRLGGEDGLPLGADVAVTLGDKPGATANLHSAQLDIDRLAGAPVDATKPNPPPQLPSLRRLRELLAGAKPPLPTTLDVAIDNATWGGEALTDVALHLRPATDDAGSLQVSGDGPGGLDLALDGTLRAEGFTGAARLRATDLPRTLAWLGTVAPAIAPTPATLPFSAAGLSGTLRFDATGLDTANATLDLDGSRLAGSMQVTFADGARPARLAADLRTERLGLDTLPDLHAVDRGAARLDYDVRLAAGTVRVASIGNGALDTGRLSLDIAARDGAVDLRSLRVDDLGGAALSVTGKLKNGTLALSGTMDASRLEAAAALLRRAAPGPWSDALAERAPLLSPAHLQIAVGTALSSTGATDGIPSTLRVDGTLAGTTVAAKLGPGADDLKAATLRAGSGDALALLRQLGFPTAPEASPVGEGTLTLSASGDPAKPLATAIGAELGTTRLTVDGRFDLFGKNEGGSGTIALRGPDLAPLLRALGSLPADAAGTVPADLAGALAVGGNGIALGDIKGRVAGTRLSGTLKVAPASGDAPSVTGTLDLDHLALADAMAAALGPARMPAKGVAWSNEPFAAAAPSLPRTAVTLHVGKLDLGSGITATDAALDARLQPGLVGASHAEAMVGSGRIGGAFTLRRDGRQATLEADLTADRVPLAIPALSATLSGKLDLAGSGGSALALVNSLAGSGAATLADVRVPGADPTALPRIFKAVEEDTLSVDEEAVTRALSEATTAPFSTATRHVVLGVAGGALTMSPDPGIVDDTAPVATSLGATLDLRTFRLAVRATETLHALPKDWSGPPPVITITQAGPIAAPRRSFDVAGLLNAVAARAIARESARVEAYEFDLRERSLFNTRLGADHRREADRLKAEADARAAVEAARRAAELARKAEAERRARAEAARQDAAKQDAAKQDAARPDAPAAAPRAAPAEGAPGPAPRFDAPPAGVTSDPGAAGRY